MPWRPRPAGRADRRVGRAVPLVAPPHPADAMDAVRCAAIARRLYAQAPPALRALSRLRPYILPCAELAAAVPPGAAVLDIGCGAGLLLALLAASGRLGSGVGLDSSGPAIAAANAMRRRLAPALRGRVAFLRQDAAQAWPAGPWDVVALVDVLHHVPPAAQRGLVERACAAVRPGGLLLVKDMAPRPAWMALANRCHDLVLARQWVHHRDLGEVVAWAEAAGCRALARRRWSRLCYAHEGALLRRVADRASAGLGGSAA